MQSQGWFLLLALSTAGLSFAPVRGLCPFLPDPQCGRVKLPSGSAPWSRCQHCAFSASPDDGAEGKDSSARSVARRKLIDAIEAYTGPTTTAPQWRRLQNYLYHHSSGKKQLPKKQIHEVLTFLTQRLDRELAVHIVQSVPRIFRKNVATQLEPTLDFLAYIYPAKLLPQAVHRKPELLLTRGIGYTADDELGLMPVFLESELGMSPAQIRRLQTGDGAVLFQLPMYKVLQSVAFFRNLLEESLKVKRNLDDVDEQAERRWVEKSLQKLVMSHPQLLHLSVEKNLRPRIEFLRRRCNLEKGDMAILLKSSAAGILGLSIENNLEPKLDFIDAVLHCRSLDHMAVPDKSKNQLLKACVLTHPQILGLSLENLNTKVTFLNGIGFGNTTSNRRVSLASRVLQRAPAVLSLSLTENIMPTVQCLAKVWDREQELPDDFPKANEAQKTMASSEKESLAALIGETPIILTLSLSRNIMPTVEFYNATGYICLDDKWRNTGSGDRTVLRGRYIASSLSNRLLPRWHYVQECRGASTSSTIPLHLLASASDATFCAKMNVTLADYQGYKKEAIPRLSFSNQLESWLKSSARV